jgi:hypothetical protein
MGDSMKAKKIDFAKLLGFALVEKELEKSFEELVALDVSKASIHKR